MGRSRRSRVHAGWGALLAASAILTSHNALATGPGPTVPPGAPPLDFYPFSDTNWLSHFHNAPLVASNLVSETVLGDGNCLLMNSSNAAFLSFSLTQNGTNRLRVDQGTLILWFAASWSGTNAGGTGPGDWGRLIEIGSYTDDASIGWWSLYLNPAGDRIYFSAQTNGAGATYLSAPVTLTTNRWHMIGLTYGTNTCLYWDGVLLTNGPAVIYWPSPSVLSNGFYIGSDGATGLEQARGLFDDMSAFDYQWDASSMSLEYISGFVFYLNFLNKANYFDSAPSDPTWTPTFRAIAGPGYLTAIGPDTLGCVTNDNIWITNLVVTAMAGGSNGTATVQFEIAGGQDGVLYDVFANSVLSIPPGTNRWAWVGQGLHCVTYSISNLPNTSVFLILGQPFDPDDDGLTSAYENLVSLSNPNLGDSSGDGMLDGWKVLWGLNPSIDNTGQSGQRSNYSYDPDGFLKQLFGSGSENFGVDAEGNVTGDSP